MSRTCGVYATYVKGCRCDECRRASREYQRQRKAKIREAEVLNARDRKPYDLPTINEGDVRWHAEAACRDTDPSVFFPAGGSGVRVNWDAALNVCAGCSVRKACLDYALRTDQPVGVWGGTTPNERRGLLRQRQAVAS